MMSSMCGIAPTRRENSIDQMELSGTGIDHYAWRKMYIFGFPRLPEHERIRFVGNCIKNACVLQEIELTFDKR